MYIKLPHTICSILCAVIVHDVCRQFQENFAVAAIAFKLNANVVVYHNSHCQFNYSLSSAKPLSFCLNSNEFCSKIQYPHIVFMFNTTFLRTVRILRAIVQFIDFLITCYYYCIFEKGIFARTLFSALFLSS